MNKDSLRIAAISIVVVLAGFVFAYQFVEPAPPREITIASGGPSGAYYAFAKRYHDVLARQGIKLNVLQSAGSIENIALLSSGKADVAFVQGGTGDAAANPELVSLGSLYFEPLWVFVRAGLNVTKVIDLNGLKVAAGAEGSGTWAVAQQLLALNRIPTDAPVIAHLSSDEAVRALLSGGIDAAFFVSSPNATLIRELLRQPRLSLLNFDRAAAYTRQHRYLSAVTLHQGVISLSDNIPTHDTTLLAPAATLAAREDLHPALQTLIVQAAAEIHGSGGVFEEPGQFPSTRYLDYPLSDDARRYLENGPSFLERYLPFWAAVLVDRLKVMVIPLITLMIPLAKILPPAYRWRIRSRIYRWYKDLIRIEQAALNASDPTERQALINELSTMADEVRDLHVPLSYTDEVYNLRLHIEMVLRTLNVPAP
ncbi:TAXI family TRAP transporter solute-binding subunit [Magnetovibrio sp.]|uniref:TAXI family TRAP transporter solute-binding subunit n=1 Tax=Magnetovibrio sp. TaxID=2024836 RepID=UPI002F95EAD3